jgi:small subunit ribosomal protein S18
MAEDEKTERAAQPPHAEGGERRGRYGSSRADGERGGEHFEGRASEGRGGMRRRPGGRRKVCRFCADKSLKVDYKDSRTLGTFLTEGGKIVPSRTSGNCAKHQRQLAVAIKRSRVLAMLPFSTLGG